LERWLRKEKKMLKKSLIAIAVLAMVMPVMAATTVDAKFHKPWTSRTVYSYQDVQTINVVMDVGYWIEIKYDGDIKVVQDASLGDPFFSYSGCKEGIAVKTNFAATLKAKVESKSAAGGNWSATIMGASTYDVPKGTSTINVCVAGKEVAIQNLEQADNIRVALVTIQVVPTEYKGMTDC